MVKSEQLTFETDFRYAPDYIERITTSPQLITYFYGPVEIYNGGEIRKNFAGSYDAFVGGKCIR